MKRVMMAAVLVMGTSGCATVLNDATHPVRVETKTPDGEFIAGADCSITNDKARFSAKSGETVQVRRSSKDLDITCTYEGLPPASGRAISRTNAGMWGNIILGGAVGAIVDHNKGTAYTYPTWIQLIFGRTLTFDRRDEGNGEPVAAKEISRVSDSVFAAAVATDIKPDQPVTTSDPYPLSAPRAVPTSAREKDPAKRCDACKDLSIP